ncbi:carbon storage regulator CsrA [Thermogutta sp.]|uniref:carbon storage regulator CsrA n=1 Tax=Thermogutta sp. TaxID=1962930 RepID=UPI0032205C50
MLVLSRKCNEQIVIGDDIIITVVAIKGGTVRLGIEAPPHVSVHREEVLRAIRQAMENRNPGDENNQMPNSNGR